MQAAHRHNMPRRFEGDAQLGTLPVKHGAIREQPAVQLQKQPVPEGVEADRGRGWHPQLFFFFGSGAGVLQRCGQAVGGQIDLDKVVHNAQTHAAFDIVELLIARQHDEGRQGGAVLMAGFRKRKAVHDRHTDVGNHDVRLLFLNGPERLGTVAGGADDLIAQRGPVQHALHTDQDQRLIVYKQDSGHKKTPFYFWLSGPGRRIVTVVPMSGSLSMLRP